MELILLIRTTIQMISVLLILINNLLENQITKI